MNIDELKEIAYNRDWLFDIDELTEEDRKLTVELVPYMRKDMSFAEQLALMKAIKYDREELACLIKVIQDPKLTDQKKRMYARVIVEILPNLDEKKAAKNGGAEIQNY